MSLFLSLLQARLELALGYTPNWILSPTRLPIPPLEHVLNRSAIYKYYNKQNSLSNNKFIYIAFHSIYFYCDIRN